MTSLSDCPEFNYETHPNRNLFIFERSKAIVLALRQARLDGLSLCVDSRPIHGRLFTGLTPQGFEYYAGHYRGENYLCLRRYEVMIGTSPGALSYLVGLRMVELEKHIKTGLAALDAAHADRTGSDVVKLRKCVEFVCHVFIAFLSVHPYANGNGHIARFICWAVLGRYGYWPRHWTIEPRPGEPYYSLFIAAYLAGSPEHLERLMLQSF